MKTMIRFLAAGFMVVLASGCAPMAKKSKPIVHLPKGALNATEVTALFTGYTAESVLLSNGRISLTYYDPNGGLRQLQDGKKRSGTWQVRKDGRICLDFSGERERCRIIVKEGPVYYKYAVKKDGKHQRILTYKSFRKGNQVD